MTIPKKHKAQLIGFSQRNQMKHHFVEMCNTGANRKREGVTENTYYGRT